MRMNSPGCKWCHSQQTPPAHALMDRPHPTHPAVVIVVNRHVESPFEMTLDAWADLRDMLSEARNHLAQFNPSGFTLGWNVGSAAGQHVFHAHMHVICRFENEPHAGHGLRNLVLR